MGDHCTNCDGTVSVPGGNPTTHPFQGTLSFSALPPLHDRSRTFAYVMGRAKSGAEGGLGEKLVGNGRKWEGGRGVGGRTRLFLILL
eukprot:1292079-Rhodomonas_salina.1